MKTGKTYRPTRLDDAFKALRGATGVVAFLDGNGGLYVELTTPLYRSASMPESERRDGMMFDDDAETWARLDAVVSAFD